MAPDFKVEAPEKKVLLRDGSDKVWRSLTETHFGIGEGVEARFRAEVR